MRKIEGIKYGEPMIAHTESKVHYPQFSIDLKHLPEAKKWKPGEKYRIILDVTMHDKTVTESKDAPDRGYSYFDIIGIGTGKAEKSYKQLPDKK